jgi:hypothetical protein
LLACRRKVRRVVKRAFQKLYCIEFKKAGGLRRVRFLRDYFDSHSTRKHYLPRSALRKRLRRALPQNAQALRKRLLSLK